MNHEKLIDDLCAYFDAKLSDTPTEQEKQLFPQLVDLRRSMKNGNTEIRTVSTWWIFWRSKGSEISVTEGFDERDALTRLGYGNGAVTAIDFIADAPTRWRLVLPVTLGDHDHENTTKVIVEWYKEHLQKMLSEFIEENKPEDLVRLWRGMRDQQARQQFLYKDREFTKQFCAMTTELMESAGDYLTRHHFELFLGSGDEEE